MARPSCMGRRELIFGAPSSIAANQRPRLSMLHHVGMLLLFFCVPPCPPARTAHPSNRIPSPSPPCPNPLQVSQNSALSEQTLPIPSPSLQSTSNPKTKTTSRFPSTTSITYTTLVCILNSIIIKIIKSMLYVKLQFHNFSSY